MCAPLGDAKSGWCLGFRASMRSAAAAVADVKARKTGFDILARGAKAVSTALLLCMSERERERRAPN
jgi:hypothetical protein